MPFQKQYSYKTKEVDNNTNILRKFFSTINTNNLHCLAENNSADTPPIDCKYVDYDSFNYVKNEKDFLMLHMNISSLGKHKEEFEIAHEILKYKFDIIGLSETKIIKNTDAIFDISLQGYNCYHKPTEASKGGTILYINNKLNSKPRIDLENLIYKSKELESSFVEI